MPAILPESLSLLPCRCQQLHHHATAHSWACWLPELPLLQVKDEGWWLVVGDTSRGDLLAIKRVSFGQRTTTR